MCSVGTLFAQYSAGYVGSGVERRGKDAKASAAWSMAELQALLDEWIVAIFSGRLRSTYSLNWDFTSRYMFAA